MEGKLVQLTVVCSLIEAKVIVSMLEAHGMFAFAPTETVGNAPYLTTALGGIEIKVVDADLEAAQALLADINTADGPAPVERKPLSTIAGEVISTFGFGVPPASPPRRKKGA